MNAAPSHKPSPAHPLKLGTRRSPLALAQAEEARARLCTAHGWSESAVELVPVIASGDKVQDRPLAEIGGKALWTKELDRALLDGEIDCAVLDTVACGADRHNHDVVLGPAMHGAKGAPHHIRLDESKRRATGTKAEKRLGHAITPFGLSLPKPLLHVFHHERRGPLRQAQGEWKGWINTNSRQL